LAFVGPVTTVVAIVIAAFSFGVSRQALEATQASAKVAEQSLKISELNMKVAQRAYLAIANGRVEYAIAFNKKSPRASTATASVTFQIQNLGNTPADISFIRFNASAGDPFIMSAPENVHGLFLTSPETTIGPKSSRVEQHSLRFTTDQQTLDFIEFGNKEPISASLFTNPLTITIDVVYKDVFGETLGTSACIQGVSRSKATIDCTPDQFK
jgi:hypothetical protein